MKEFLKGNSNILKDPSTKDIVNNMIKDPSEIESLLNESIFRTKIQNNPFIKFVVQNPQFIINNFQNIQIFQNMFKESKINSIDSGTEIFNPPDPFENLDNNQNMNSSSQVPNINTFNNNNIENKGNFINSEINIDYNIQALNQYNGNIGNAIDKILEQNN